MADLLLQTETQRALGTRPSRRLRREGKIPGVVYGLGGDSVPITVDAHSLRAVLTTPAGLNALLTLEVNGEQQLSLVKELQRHPVRHDVIHVDFIRVDASQEVEVEVRIVLVGSATAVTNEGGTVEQALFNLSVISTPQNIPNELHADISDLTLGTSLRVHEIPLPEGVRLAGDPDEVVANTSVAIEEELPEEEEELLEGMEAEDGEEAAEGEDAEEAAEADDEA